MKAFVTGADGFIGSHLTEALRDAGHEVTGLALYNSFDSYGWLDEVEGVEKVRGDVRDVEQMRALIKGQDVVFHLAALVSVPYSYQAPQSFIDTNVTGTLNVLMAARDAAAKLVHTSTSEVYGSVPDEPITEAHPIWPSSPYAASKVAADALVRSFHLSYELPAVTLRPFNTYGPRQSERALVATIIRQMLDPACGRAELGNFDARRDLTYITDTVAAFLAVAKLEEFGVYNAGTGRFWGVTHVGGLIQKIVGTDKSWVSRCERLRPSRSEVAILQADATKLCTATGWEPHIALYEGLELTVAWWRSRSLNREQRYVA